MLFTLCRAIWIVGWLPLLTIVGCQKKDSAPSKEEVATTAKPTSVSATPSSGAAPSAQTQPQADDSTAQPTKDQLGENVLKLAGLHMTPPDGWGPIAIREGQFANKVIIPLPRVEGDADGATVEITHFPGMKGKDDLNINRWLATVARSDGTPHTRETAPPEIVEMEHVRLTVLDMSGTVGTRMFGSGGGLPDHRMIAAIVDHPKGPHFVKIVGPAATMEKWAGSINTFLRSAIVDPHS